LHLCLWNAKKFCKALVGVHPHILNHPKGIKNEEDMGLELEMDLEFFYKKN
jgi:hypothetical protein